jgi:hypothetical protein
MMRESFGPSIWSADFVMLKRTDFPFLVERGTISGYDLHSAKDSAQKVPDFQGCARSSVG